MHSGVLFHHQTKVGSHEKARVVSTPFEISALKNSQLYNPPYRQRTLEQLTVVTGLPLLLRSSRLALNFGSAVRFAIIVRAFGVSMFLVRESCVLNLGPFLTLMTEGFMAALPSLQPCTVQILNYSPTLPAFSQVFWAHGVLPSCA